MNKDNKKPKAIIQEENAGKIDFDALDADPESEYLLIMYKDLRHLGPGVRRSIHALRTSEKHNGSRILQVLINNALQTGELEEVIQLCDFMIGCGMQAKAEIIKQTKRISGQN
jgi:hypothetical protein